jgi:hypothetical protein
MFFYVGSLALAFFGGVFLPLLIGIPWWVAIITTPVMIIIRIIITGREKAQPIMDAGNGAVIGLFLFKMILL